MTAIRDDGVQILMGRYGPAHAFPQGGGGYTLCRRQAALCVRCKEDGVPLYPPDRFEVTRALMHKYYGHFWYDSYRAPVERDEYEVSLMEGLCIYVRDGDETVVIANFGDHEELAMVVSAVVYEHNLAHGLE